MELLPDGVCVLCEQNTAILSHDSIKPYVKYVTKAFFEKNKQALTEFQEKATNESLCVLCTHKVVISHKFKDYYEDIVKKQSSFKKTRAACFLCDSKVAELISTDDNPNDFTTKIKIFMEASLYPRPFKQCVTCFDCLFYLNVWFDVYVGLMKKLNMEDLLTNSKEADSPKKTLRKTQADNVNHTPTTKASILKKDKENVTPPAENKAEKSAKRVRIASESPVEAPPRKVSRLSLKSNSGRKVITNGESVQSSPAKFNQFLKKELKHLKSIKQINNIAHYPNDVKKDKKFFDRIPYVLVTRNADKQTKADKRNKMEVEVEVHQPKPGPMSRRKPGPMSRTRRSAQNNGKPVDNTRKSERINKEPEIIELSDSGDEKKGNKKKNNKTQTPLKLPFKIRLSAKFQYNSSPKTSKKRGNLSLKQAKHACNVCDEIFIAFCDYKRHTLWHEKPEAPKVDVIRHKLPTHIKASEFIAGGKTKTKKNVDSAKISKLVKKYMDETVTELFDDTEFTQPNEIGNIIDNLNTSDSEEKSKQETTDLEKQKDSNKDVTVTENGQPEEAEVEKTEGSESKSDKTEEAENEETTEIKKTKSKPKAQITDDENNSKGSDDEKEESRSKHSNAEKEETRSKDSEDENEDNRSKHLEDEKAETRSKHSDDENEENRSKHTDDEKAETRSKYSDDENEENRSKHTDDEKAETRSKHSDDENEDNRSKHTDDEKEESLSKGSDNEKETQNNEREECVSKSSDDEKEENQLKASDDQKEETRTKDSDEEKDQSKDSDEEKDQSKDSEDEKDQSKDSDVEKESSSLKESDEAEANVSNEIQNGEVVDEKSSQDTDDVEVRSDSDRTSVDEDEEKENDSEQTENNSEHNIEKVLAEMHGEADESEETEEADKESGDEACNENGDESFETANGEDEDEETIKKRKRVNSDDEESDRGSGDENPKAKKVRFAMDYQSPNKTTNDSEGAQSDQETTSSTDVIEENTLRLSEDDNE